MTKGRVLGLDLSLTSTGWALVDERGQYDVGIVSPPEGEKHLELRLASLVKALRPYVPQADIVVVEQPFSGMNGTTGAMVFGGAAVLIGIEEAPMVVVPPTSLKKYAFGKATTLGTSTKTASVVSARERLKYQGYSDDETDALWLAHVGWHLIGRPVVDLPKHHTDTLSAKWATGWPAGPAEKPTIKAKPRRKTQV